MLAAIGVLTALAGWLAAQVEPSWTVRYLAVIVAPLLLAAAGALAHQPTGAGRGRGRGLRPARRLERDRVAAAQPERPLRQEQRGRHRPGGGARSWRPGDVVVITQTEQLAVLAHYLPKGLVYVTPTGPVSDPYVVDWRNIVSRLRQAQPCAAVAPSIDALPVGAHVLEVNPVRQLGASGSAWYRAVNGQVAEIDRLIATDPSLHAVGSYQEGIKPRPYSPVIGELFQRIPGADPCS